VTVPGFEIDEFKTTNGEYLQFVETGGYENRPWWSEPGWCWKTRFQMQHPVFWKRSAEGWQYRGMFEERPLPLDWPVFVSHAEASAYARWAGKELPTEAEWQRAATGTPQTSNPLDRWDPEPVHGTKAQSTFGAKGMYENGWEWTSTPFAPFPGFEPFPFYESYSRAFFDGNHFVLKGGSPRTHSTLLRPTFRNWFQPHYPYVYAGFRCVHR
jgi:formylglycine-generating enzyme required for sulfatase activity